MNGRTRRSHRAGLLLAVLWAVSMALPATAQQQGITFPDVTILPVAPVTVQPGKSAELRFSFRIREGFHINSNRPLQEVLIPTAIKLSPPADMLIGALRYPAGEQMQLPFLPEEKISVYSGRFEVGGVLKTTTAILPGTYPVRGELRYQACSDRQCFPPRTTEFHFEVKVVRPAQPKRNPPQSPHA